MNNNTIINLNSKRVGRQDPNKIQFDEGKCKSIKFELKCTQHSVAKQMEVSRSTICRWKKKKVIRKHTNAIKQTLNEKNKLHMLSFELSKCQYDEQNDSFKFKPHTNIIHIDEKHTNIVHIDEKHFYLTQETQTYYLTLDKLEPHRECHSKRFIPKIMFMCTVANPIFSTNSDVFFDGKIRIWPFITQ